MTGATWAAAHGARALVFVEDAVGPFAPSDGSDASDEPDLWIDGPDGHHLERVRRLDVDESVVVANGVGQWYPGRIAATRTGSVMIERAGPNRREPALEPTLTIAFAPAKSDHGTEVVHQLVELGVDRIIPIITHRSVVRWDADRAVKTLDRLRRVSREAAMQCHRARVPIIEAPAEIATLCARDGLLIGDAAGGSVLDVARPKGGEWVAISGPEGGLTRQEMADLVGSTRIRVGPHVLRSVTAPVAIAAALASCRNTES